MKPAPASQTMQERQDERRSNRTPQPHEEHDGLDQGARDARQAQQQPAEHPRTELILQPPVDIFETPERIVLLADLPGVTRDGLEITVHRGRLTINGTVSIPRTDGRIPGRYQRVFQLTEVVDQSHVSAELRDGVLRLEMPKRREFQPQRVQVAVRDSATRAEPQRAGQTGSGASDGPADAER